MEFKDLQREVKPATGEFETYFFNVKPIFGGGLWEVSSSAGRDIFRKTIDRFVSFSSKLEHAFIPPRFIEELSKEENPVDRILAFSAGRDYFTLHVSPNPGLEIVGDSADLRLKSTNAGRDFQVLVKKSRPVGPLLLDYMDFKLKEGSSECKIRIASDGYLSQIGRGDQELYYRIRERVLQFFEGQDKWTKFIPRVEREEVSDAKKVTSFKSKKPTQFGKPFLVEFNFHLDKISLLKLKGLFTSNFHGSQFIGTVENEVQDRSFVVRTSDLRGGGDAMLRAEIDSSLASVIPLMTTKIRTLERIYRVLLEKFDVDSELTAPKM